MSQFKHPLGSKVKDRVTNLVGIVVSRSECLYGCNRYYVQAAVGKDNKVPDGWWTDEDQLNIIGKGIAAAPKDTGGPMSRVC